MTDRPIIFSAPMIRALLDGRKTMTRRVLKLPTKTHSGGPIYERPDMGGWEPTTHGGGGCFTIGRDGKRIPAPEIAGLWHKTTGTCIAAPYASGDRLWVRESWRPGAWRDDGHVAVDYRASQEENRTPWLTVPEDQWGDLWIRMSDEAEKACKAGKGSIRRDFEGYTWDRGDSPCKWRQSIHMPRWASRLTLNVRDIMVERLQTISDVDACAEGIGQNARDGLWTWAAPGISSSGWHTPRGAFDALWTSIHGPDAWVANPWVAAISFDVRRENIDAAEIANRKCEEVG